MLTPFCLTHLQFTSIKLHRLQAPSLNAPLYLFRFSQLDLIAEFVTKCQRLNHKGNMETVSIEHIYNL